MTNIVFLLGEAGVGKDTIAEEFVKRGFKRISFADALKKEYSLQNNVNVKILHTQGPEKENHRLKLIEFAEAKRAKDPLVWINKAFEPYVNPLNGIFHDNLKLIISDLRRESEVDWYYNLWMQVELSEKELTKKIPLELNLFHVVRPGIKDTDILTAKAIGKVHGINLVVPGFLSGVINNNSTLIKLKEKVENLITNFGFSFANML